MEKTKVTCRARVSLVYFGVGEQIQMPSRRDTRLSAFYISSPFFTFYNTASRRLDHSADVALSPICQITLMEVVVLLAPWVVRIRTMDAGSSLRA